MRNPRFPRSFLESNPPLVNDPRTDVDPDASADGYKWKAFSAVALGLVTNVMSFSVIFIALNDIADDFGVTLRAVSWVVLAQSLTVTALMLPLGRVADLTGRKWFHLSGLMLFAGGSILCAASPTLGFLVGARVVMAFGSTMVQAISPAIVTSVFPAEERGKGLGSQTTAVAIGGALGPAIGGVILQFTSWQVLFVTMAIPGLIAVLWGIFILDDARIGSLKRGTKIQFDWIGGAFSAMGFVGLIVAITNPFNISYTSPIALAYTAGGVVSLVAFVYWELRTSKPMLELRLFSIRVFRYAVGTRVIGFMATSATRLLVPIFLLSLLGIGEAVTGVIMLVNAVGMGIAAQTAGRLSDRFGYRPFGVGGFVVLMGTAIAFAFFNRDTTVWIIVPVLFINGLGMGMWSAPNISATMGAVPPSSYGVVGALSGLTRNLGNVSGQAITAAIIAGVLAARGFDIPLSQISDSEGSASAFVDGWKYAYLVIASFAGIAVIGAWLTKPSPQRRESRAPAGQARTAD